MMIFEEIRWVAFASSFYSPAYFLAFYFVGSLLSDLLGTSGARETQQQDRNRSLSYPAWQLMIWGSDIYPRCDRFEQIRKLKEIAQLSETMRIANTA